MLHQDETVNHKRSHEISETTASAQKRSKQDFQDDGEGPSRKRTREQAREQPVRSGEREGCFWKYPRGEVDLMGYMLYLIRLRGFLRFCPSLGRILC